MQNIRVSFDELMKDLDDETIEQLYFSQDAVSSLSKKRILKKIRQKRNLRTSAHWRYLPLCILTVLLFSIVVGATAAGYLFHSSLITEENSPLIGTEVQDPGNGILIYKDGYYRNKQGEIIDMEELQRKTESIPENRIIEDIQDSSFIPSSVVEIPLETAESAWEIPGVILTNASVAVLTKENGDSWMLSKGDSITCSFEKYPSEAVSNQLLIVGYIKDGTLYPGDHFDMLTGNYTLTAEEDGKYFLYLLSASSDYLSIKAGEVKVQNS